MSDMVNRRTRRARLDAGGVDLLPRSRWSPVGVHRDACRSPAFRQRRPHVARVDTRDRFLEAARIVRAVELRL